MYDYVTRSQIETTNSLIEDNNELLETINTNITYSTNIIVFIITTFLLYKFTRKVLGARK